MNIIKESIEHMRGPRERSKINIEKANGKENEIKLNENINGLEGKSVKEYADFQYSILGKLKYGFVYPVVKIGEKIAGKHLFKEPPKGYAFRNFQAKHNATEKALVIWHDVYLQDLTWKHPIKRLKQFYKSTAFKTILLLRRMEMTLLLSDSAYFEYANIEMLELYREMAKIHGEQPVHVIYKNKDIINDPAYFAVCREGLDIMLKQRLQTLKPFYDSKGKLRVKYVGSGLSHSLGSVAVELNCVPNKDVMINRIREIKMENIRLKQSLVNINQQTVNGLGIPNGPTETSN